MRVMQQNFVAGELDPQLMGRLDLAKYYQGAASMRNFIVQRHGGVSKRPGTDYLMTVPTGWASGVKMAPFVFDRSNAYMLLFTDRSVRIMSLGAFYSFSIRSSAFKWVASTHGTNEYYLALADVNVRTSGYQWVQSKAKNGYSGDGDTFYLTKTGGLDPELKKPGALWLNGTLSTYDTGGPDAVDVGKWSYGISEEDDEDITFNTVYVRLADALTSIRTAAYKWTGAGVSGWYYLELAAGGSPGINLIPHRIKQSTSWATYTATLTGSSYRWAYGDFNSLGHNTIYCHLSDLADPDGKAENYVQYLPNIDPDNRADGYVLVNATDGDTEISEPEAVLANGVTMASGTVGSLTTGAWGWDDNDSLGYDTVYVRLSDGTDPDDKTAGYVTMQVGLTLPYLGSELPELRFYQSGDTLFLTHPNHPPAKIVRYTNTLWKYEVINWNNLSAAPEDVYAAWYIGEGNTPTAQKTIRYKVALVDEETGAESMCSDPIALEVESTWPSGGTVVIALENYADRGSGLFGWWVRASLSTGVYMLSLPSNADTFAPSPLVEPTAIYQDGKMLTKGNPWTTASTWTWFANRLFVRLSTSADPDSYAGLVAIEWPSIKKMRVYKNIRGVWGLVGIVEGGVFVDDNVAPALSDAPITIKTPFDGTGKYPAIMSIFQQRSVWARTDARPHTIFMSRTGDLYNMGISEPLKDDDAITASLPALRSSEIRAMVPMRKMLVLTEESEWTVGAQSNAEGLTPRSVEFMPQSYFGSCDIQPIVINSSVMFIQRDGRVIREYGYDLKSDGLTGMDRSVLSAHLFEGRTIVSWTYQQNPGSVIWAAMSDGSLLSMTYMPEQDIWAWARHDTVRGRVIDVCATGALMSDIDGDPTETDEVYLLVERDDGNNANTELFIERMRRLPVDNNPEIGQVACLDCMQRVHHASPATAHATSLPDGSATLINAVTGVAQTVTITGGSVTTAAMAEVLIGQPISSELTTIRPEPQQVSVQGLKKRITKTLLRLRRSLGGTLIPYGSRAPADTIRDLAAVVTAPAGAATDGTVALISGDRDVAIKGFDNMDGQFTLTHANHWPFTLLMVVLSMEVETDA